MSKLALEQQVQVLEHGIELLKKWIGKPPIAHRSGGYSINQDTLEALRKVGIPVDSSMNVAHSHSKVTWSTNQVLRREGVLELPITVLEYQFQIPKPRGRYSLYSKIMKTDLDTCTLDEFLYFISAGEEGGLNFMNLFMHSYSLLKFDYCFRKFEPNPKNDAKLRGFLAALCSHSSVQVMDCTSFFDYFMNFSDAAKGIDAVPQVKANRHISHLGLKKIKNKALELFL